MARFHCSECAIDREVPEKYLGRKVRCPGCGKEIPVREQDAAQTEEQHVSTFPSGPAASASAAPDAPRATGAAFHCASCGHDMPVPEHLAGRKARCPQCGVVGTVAAPTRFVSPPNENDLDLDDLAEDFAAHMTLEGGSGRQRTQGEHQGQPGIGDSLDELASSTRLTANLSGAKAAGPARKIANGLCLGLTTVLFCLALALAPALGAGSPALYPAMLQMALTAALLGCLYYSLRSRVAFAAAGPEGVTCAGLFLLAQAAAGLPLSGGSASPPEALAATIVGAVLLSALLSGLLCFFLSQINDGNWMRFVPFPVVGGVLAGLGLLLIQVAYQAGTGEWLNLGLLLGAMHGKGGSLYADGLYWRWLPSALAGLVLFLFYRRIRTIWLLALPLPLSLGWHLAAPSLDLAGRIPGLAAVESLHPLQPEALNLASLQHLHSLSFLVGADWTGLVGLTSLMVALALLLAVNASAKALVLEEHLGREVSPGPELRALGATNILSGLAVGFPVSLSLGRSLGNLRSGGLGIAGALAAALVCGAALFAGGPLLSAIPPILPVGLLWFMGLNLLKRWLVDVIAEDLRSEEYACLLLTFAVTVALGFAPGVVVGVVLALVLGLARHSPSAAIKSRMSGDAHHSNVDRVAAQADALHELGESIFILRLQGFLSGGSLSAAMRAVWERMEEPGRRALRSVVLDFAQVKGVGSGLTRVLAGMARLGRDSDVRMVLTNVPFVLEERLEKVGLVDSDQDQIRGAGQERKPGAAPTPEREQRGFVVFHNLDYALEWCEDRLLAEAGILDAGRMPLEELFAPVFQDKAALPQLLRILQRMEIRAGEYVFRQGDASDSMFFVESGMLTVELEIPGGKTVRLKKLGPGSIFGEMGLYTHTERSASVRASERSVVQRLSKKRLAILQEKLPHLAKSLDNFLVTLLARRVADANIMVRDLMR